VRGALLVADQHVANRGLRHRIVGRQIAPPGYPNTVLTPCRISDSQMICAPVFFMARSLAELKFGPTYVVLESTHAPMDPWTRGPMDPWTYPVIAPSAAELTSRAYFAITPLV
jgi:hypothetical protein